jgi:hypothetical protein
MALVDPLRPRGLLYVSHLLGAKIRYVICSKLLTAHQHSYGQIQQSVAARNILPEQRHHRRNQHLTTAGLGDSRHLNV